MAQEPESIKTKIREFILEAARRRGVKEVANNEVLMTTGALDSLGVFRLVAFLEDNFGVRIADEEITHENFRSIDVIERFVDAKLRARSEKT